MKPVICFDSPPPVGTRITYFRKQILTLVAVHPYTRRDGTASFILTWETTKGRRGTSGLRSSGVTWPSGAAWWR